MRRVKVTARAKLDLFSIWEYIAQDSIPLQILRIISGYRDLKKLFK